MNADIRNTRTGLMAAGLAVAMVGAAYASVPLYRLFCQVTGFGGTPMVRTEATAPATTGKPMRVRFDGNVRGGLPWTFTPTERVVDLPSGERRITWYRATNTSSEPVTGVATYNVSPTAAGAYFAKIQCFCFNEQTLQPGESVEMPVVFYVDPAIADDPDAAKIEEITLSYSFFPVEKRTQPAGIRATGEARIPARKL
jgi:cytochrome c oxidase assembly protein subunit 11